MKFQTLLTLRVCKGLLFQEFSNPRYPKGLRVYFSKNFQTLLTLRVCKGLLFLEISNPTYPKGL